MQQIKEITVSQFPDFDNFSRMPIPDIPGILELSGDPFLRLDTVTVDMSAGPFRKKCDDQKDISYYECLPDGLEKTAQLLAYLAQKDNSV